MSEKNGNNQSMLDKLAGEEVSMEKLSKEEMAQIINEQSQLLEQVQQQQQQEEGGQPPQPPQQQPQQTPLPESEEEQMVQQFMNALQHDDPTQAQQLLAQTLRDAGIDPTSSPKKARKYLQDLARTFETLPDTPQIEGVRDEVMTEASQKFGQAMLQQGQQGNQDRMRAIIQEIAPMWGAAQIMKSLGMSGQESEGKLSDLEQMLLSELIGNKRDKEGSTELGKLDRKLTRMQRQLEEGGGVGTTELSRFAKVAERLSKQKEELRNAVKKLGFAEEDQGTIDKLRDSVSDIKSILNDVGDIVPEGAKMPKPKKDFKEASPSEEPREIPVEKETEE